MPNDPALAGIGWGEGESPSASFTGESWGYAGFLFCCCQITPHGLGPQLCPSQFLCLCASTTPSLKCLLLFLIQSSVHLIPGLSSPNTLSDFTHCIPINFFQAWTVRLFLLHQLDGSQVKGGPSRCSSSIEPDFSLTKFEMGVGGKEPAVSCPFLPPPGPD